MEWDGMGCLSFLVIVFAVVVVVIFQFSYY